MTALLALFSCVIVTDAELQARKAELGVDSAIGETGDDTDAVDDPALNAVTVRGAVSAPAGALLRSGSARVGLITVDLSATNLVSATPTMWATSTITGLLVGSSGEFVLDGLSPPQDLGAPFGADPAARGALFALVAWVDANKDGAFNPGEQPIDIGLARLLVYSSAPSERAVEGGLPAGYSLVSLDLGARTLSGAVSPTDRSLSLDLPGALLPLSPNDVLLELERSVERDLNDLDGDGRVAVIGRAAADGQTVFPVLKDEVYDGDGAHTLAGPFAEPPDSAFSGAWAVEALTSRQVEIAAYLGVAYEDNDGDLAFSVAADDVLGATNEKPEPRDLIFVRATGFQAALAMQGLKSFGWLIVDDSLPVPESPTLYTDGLVLGEVRQGWR